VLTAYLLSASICTPIMGRLGDMIGKKRVFVAALIALAVGSLLAAIATNIGLMIFARAIQGVGGGIIPLAFGIIRDEFPPAKVASAIGTIASIIAVGAGVGIVLAGPIVNALDYHWLFWFPMIITLVAAVAAHFFVPESPAQSGGRISWPPAIALSAWLVALLVALSEAPMWGWGSPKVVGLLIAAVVFAGIWILCEQRAKTPLIDLNMMRLPAVWTNNLVALLMGVAMYGSFAFLPEFVQTPTESGYGFGASITESGLILLPASVTMFGVGLYAARIAARIGGKLTIVIGCLIGMVSMAIIAFAHSEKWELYLSTAIMGVAFGLVYAAVSSLVVAAVPPDQTGVASGMNANIRTIGGSIGAALVASVVTSQLGADGLPKEIGYTVGFAILALAFGAAGVAAMLIPNATDRREIDPDDEPAHPQLAIVAGGTVIGDKPE
jgi:EmrB/QacA subfamily drug resistance transporter